MRPKSIGVPVIVDFAKYDTRPSWFQNWVDHAEKAGHLRASPLPAVLEAREKIRLLKRTGGDWCLIFPDEPTYTMFLLKWD